MAARRKRTEPATAPPPAAVPARGLTDRCVRLTYPGKWHKKEAAERFVRDNGLDNAGVSVVEADGAWRIVIDTHRAPMITPWLRTQYPGVAWSVGWTPAP